MSNVKTRYWVAVGYPENMIENWQDEIFDVLQLPFCYCVHDKDKLQKVDRRGIDQRKVHVHIMVCWNNTTTYKAALNAFNALSKDGCRAFNTCEPVHSVRHMYDYLIHDTSECLKAGKYLYGKSERVCGNNFDIGLYEQLSIDERKEIRNELTFALIDGGFMNYLHFVDMVRNNFDSAYLDVLISNSSHFERLCRARYMDKCGSREFVERVASEVLRKLNES